MSVCASEPKMPTSIVSSPHTIRTLSREPSGNSNVWARMMA